MHLKMILCLLFLAGGYFLFFDKNIKNGGDHTENIQYAEYKPSNNFEDEFRYYIENTYLKETRPDFLMKTDEMIALYTIDGVLEYYDQESFQAIRDEAADVTIKTDRLYDILLPVYKRHFTLTDLQNMNH